MLNEQQYIPTAQTQAGLRVPAAQGQHDEQAWGYLHGKAADRLTVPTGKHVVDTLG